jgi:hypothetical protein
MNTRRLQPGKASRQVVVTKWSSTIRDFFSHGHRDGLAHR